MSHFRIFLFGIILTGSFAFNLSAEEKIEAFSTDSLYEELIRTVVENDFDGMAATYHKDAVLVSPKSTALISNVIPRWRADGEKLKASGGRATLSFRFKRRQVDETTAFEQGIFRYGTMDAEGKESIAFVHFEDLNLLIIGKWHTIMERQMGAATADEWNALSQ
jgi:hypothetical protein